MLNSIYRALVSHLSRLRIPVYLADSVPQGAAFPYITATIEAPLTADHAGTLTLTVWCTGGSANSMRLSHTDALYSLLPCRGACLNADTGSILLRQSGTAACVQDASALGMQSRWTLRYIPAV